MGKSNERVRKGLVTGLLRIWTRKSKYNTICCRLFIFKAVEGPDPCLTHGTTKRDPRLYADSYNFCLYQNYLTNSTRFHFFYSLFQIPMTIANILECSFF